MTDINEAIARWMGWRPLSEPGDEYCWADPDGKHRCAEVHATYYVPAYPRYTESLDAQVPVWEALQRKGCRIGLNTDGLAVVSNRDRLWEIGNSPHPAEAAAKAIHAALVAMGEIDNE